MLAAKHGVEHGTRHRAQSVLSYLNLLPAHFQCNHFVREEVILRNHILLLLPLLLLCVHSLLQGLALFQPFLVVGVHEEVVLVHFVVEDLEVRVLLVEGPLGALHQGVELILYVLHALLEIVLDRVQVSQARKVDLLRQLVLEALFLRIILLGLLPPAADEATKVFHEGLYK